MSDSRIEGYIQMVVGAVVVLQTALRPESHTSTFSSLMFILSGLAFFVSGVARVRSADGRSINSTLPSDSERHR